MSEQTTAPADPTAPDPRDARIAELEQELAAANASSEPGQPTDPTAPVDASAVADAVPGQIVRYRTAPANGAAPSDNYGLVLDVVETDAGAPATDAAPARPAGGAPIDGQPTRRELLVARLDVQHNRLLAEQVTELIG